MTGTHLVRELCLHFLLRDPPLVRLFNGCRVHTVRSLHSSHGCLYSAVIVAACPLLALNEHWDVITGQILRVLRIVELPLILLQLPIDLSISLARHLHFKNTSIEFNILVMVTTSADLVGDFILSDSAHGLTWQSRIMYRRQGTLEIDIV